MGLQYGGTSYLQYVEVACEVDYLVPCALGTMLLLVAVTVELGRAEQLGFPWPQLRRRASA
jgi:hypothetical protein